MPDEWPGPRECEADTTYVRDQPGGDGTHYHVDSVDRDGPSPVVVGHWEVRQS